MGQLGNTKHRAWCFYHLGGIFLTLKDSRNAEKNYHVAYQMLEDEGNISHLWKVKEGLGDLHTVTYQYSAAVTYYKEALALIGIQSSRNVIRDQRRIVDKLTAVLDSQKNGGKRDIHISYNDRRPVVLPMSYESSLEYSSIGLPPVPNKVNGPSTSTPVGADGKRSKRRSSKREKAKKGKKRSDLLTAPVPNGVGEYDSGSDLSLVEREMRRQLSMSCFLGARRSHSLPKDLENTYEDPTGSDEGKPSLLQRSASQEELREGKRNGWRIFGRKRSGSSSDSSSSSGLETVSVKSHSQSTSGTQTIPLYATIDRKKTGEMTANFFTGTGGEMSSTIPSRWAPDPPEVPPTLPPNHPSFIERNKHPSGSSEGGQEYPETTVMNNLSRSQREAELYEVARDEQEFWKQQDHSPHHEYRKQIERRRSSVRNSRMCLVM
ncbi:hypothetical protein BSL78_12002 [Apostichopus japonicus]|uniref:Uncharacterized protein n=1 Tax=Stichopus japonicus TaxID=307972 RepID=A0A2G8KSZ1_STIJA|nr:hypothetical protein BSL78_12002 [Apostichopus japonicus]